MKKYDISTGVSRTSKIWKDTEVTFEQLADKLKDTKRTIETQVAYTGMTKAQQGDVKDVGGFVGGRLKNNTRRRETLMHRSLITLDLDYATKSFIKDFTESTAYSYIIYSTHTHTEDKPRLRLILPLSRNVTAEEYEAISRKIAYKIGIDMFDDSTYEAHRLMYYPSTSIDGEYLFERDCTGFDVDADSILKEYDNWKDISSWHVSSRTNKVIKNKVNRQTDPTEKKGTIGLFCRTYDIHDVISMFLSSVYEVATDDRYTFIEGSTGAGAVVYSDGKFLYSNHATDPAGQLLCNSFDLLRIHKFGYLDEDVNANTKEKSLPSFKKAMDFIVQDDKVKKLLVEERLEANKNDFEGLIEIEQEKDTTSDFEGLIGVIDGDIGGIEVAKSDDNSNSWATKLKVNAKGVIESCIENVVIIMDNDKGLKGRIRYNEFTNKIDVVSTLAWSKLEKNKVRSWSDTDDANLRMYLERVYQIKGRNYIDDGFTVVVDKNKYHPVREYLKALEWDGVKRLEFMLQQYLGAEDNSYIRYVSKMHLTSAVKRVFEPGCKYDTVLVLVGEQGVGKSEFLRKLGKSWFSDTLDNIGNKDAYEQLQGSWIIELAELAALSKKENETIKHFITKSTDIFREAYGRRTKECPRQCVFFGSTNNHEFLKDDTGNRRFIPIDTSVSARTKSIFIDLDGEIDQIWAEAYAYYVLNDAEAYIHDAEIQKLAQIEQDKHFAESVRTGEVLMHVAKKLPENWDTLDLAQRRQYYNGNNAFEPLLGTTERTRVCALEIWCEMLGENKSNFTQRDARELNSILKRSGKWEYIKKAMRFGDIYGVQRGFTLK